MSYQVIARKWRPKSFGELVGQNHVAKTLLNALRSGRLPQALLFTGPRGTGKTSTARIFAKSLRCPDAIDNVPCNECSECQEIAAGRSFDVLEIDGASNNGVDAIRELRDTVGHMPSSGRFKVYIIDEVHMLSTSAFNALLKTLEEPPSHVVFVLATTEAQKIPNTVLSRCQRFDFRTIATPLIVKRLQEICAADGVEAEPEALWVLAQQSGGSMRDSQSLLEQVITAGEGRVLRDEVIAALGLTSFELIAAGLEALCTRDRAALFDVLKSLHQAGAEPKIYLQDLLRDLRNLLLVKLQPDLASVDFLEVPPSDVDRLQKLGEQLTPEDIHLLFDMALKGALDLQKSSQPQLVLEMLLLKMVQAPRVQHIEQLLRQGGPQVKAASSPAPAPKPTAPRQPERPEAPPQPAPRAASTQQPPPTPEAAPSRPAGSGPWYDLVQQVKKSNGFLGALLENASVKEITSTQLVLEVGPKLQFLRDQLREADNKARIESFVKTLWQKDLELKVDIHSEDGPTSPSLKKSLRDQELVQKKSAEQAADRHPLVQELKKNLNARIVSIKENNS